jgi:hypothetical protein
MNMQAARIIRTAVIRAPVRTFRTTPKVKGGDAPHVSDSFEIIFC